MKKCPICKAEVKKFHSTKKGIYYKCINAFCGEEYVESTNKNLDIKINFKGGRK